MIMGQIWFVSKETVLLLDGNHLTRHVCDVTQAAFQYCGESSTLEPVHPLHSNIFCFRLRRRPDHGSHARHGAIKGEINESGFAYISSTVLTASERCESS